MEKDKSFSVGHGSTGSTDGGVVFAPGKDVAEGRFLLRRELGRGGMGWVWQAYDNDLQELVALKFLPPEIRSDPSAVEDLTREIKRNRKLAHPHIVKVYDLHRVKGGQVFFSMEYIDGPTLTHMRLAQADKILSWYILEPLALQLCDALHYAHQEKIVHRDIKPGNLMVDSQIRLKLADFGIARLVADSVSRVTQAKSTSGTLVYMSPQQLDGRQPRVTDDVYAVGATLYELLTSRPPFYSGDIYHQVQSVIPQPLEERLQELDLENQIPPPVQAAIMACLAKDAKDRPQSAKELADCLRAVTQAYPYAQATALRMADDAAPPSGQSEPVSPPSTTFVLEQPPAQSEPVVEESHGWKVVFALLLAGICGTAAWFGYPFLSQKWPRYFSPLPTNSGVGTPIAGTRKPATTPTPTNITSAPKKSVEAKTSAKPVAPAIHGTLLVKSSLPKEFALRDSQDRSALAEPALTGEPLALAPGDYFLILSNYDNILQEKVVIQAQQETRVEVREVLIESDPAQAEVWQNEKLLWKKTPLSLLQFKGRPLAFKLRFPGYYATNLTLGNESSVFIALQPRRGPELEDAWTQSSPWTNSLGMVFRPVESSGKVWFSIWETRVRDFRSFKDEATTSISELSQWNPVFEQDMSRKQGAFEPVICVNWTLAGRFCSWLTSREQSRQALDKGWTYRLPTDAEWSLAAGLGAEKGDTPRERAIPMNNPHNYDFYPWIGNAWPPPKDHAGNYFAGLNVDNSKYPSAVGSFDANLFGLFDMGGNAWEWCLDNYDRSLPDKVLRGASWKCQDNQMLRAWYREHHPATFVSEDIGFRCVMAREP